MSDTDRHQRIVVLGGDVCTCGLPWPCAASAEGRWNVLREHLERLHRTYTDEAAGTAVKGTRVAERIEGRADGIWDALETMRAMEAGR